VIKSLETGDRAAIEAAISPERYVQHNLRFADGRQTLLDALPSLVQAGTKARIVRTLRDGDHTVHHTEYLLFGRRQVGFDVFRFEGDQIVEHWDNLQELAGPSPDGHSMTDGATEVTELAATEANKQLVRDLIAVVFQGHQYQRLPEFISTTTYLQHNPAVADGLAGLQAAGPLLARFNYRKVHKVLGEGNFVLAMSEILFDGKEAAVYDLFRLEGGKVVEHWDVLELVPPRSEWRNANGKL